MRKNKLYTVNRFNKPAFVDRTYQNIFDGFGQTSLLNPNINPSEFWSRLGVNTQLSNPLGQVGNAAAAQTLANFAPASNTVSNPFSFKEAFSSAGLKNGLKAGAGAAVGLGANVVGGLAGNAISGGLKSGVGSAIGTIGGAAASAIGSVNPFLGAAVGVGSKILGGVTNALFGTKVDQEKLSAANEGTAAYNNFTSNASSFDDISGPLAQANVQDAYSGGVFKKGWARKKNEELKRLRTDARLFADRSIENNVFNLADNQINDALYNYSAFGGPIETMSDNMGAIGYGFMSDYLNNKKKQAEQKGQTNMFAGTPSTMFDFGGDLQTHGADFGTGLIHINAGQSHEENPYDGVQMGVDQNGTPNLVEENETIYNDYVFSARILADEATKKLFHLPKKKDITFAEISKKLEKEIAERPADPISQAGFKAQMQTLEEQQERQKQEMEAERAKAAFEALTPEEQTALMQRAAQEEQMAQQQALAEQAAIQQPSPEEAAMVEQQTMQADGSEANVGAEPPMMAEGGHLYSGEQEGSSKMQKKNVGSWKDDKQNHWDVFTKPGLKRYIENLKAKLNRAPDEETKNAIRREAMNELNTLQQSYYDYVRDGAANGTQGYSDNILNHQKMFDKLYGNTGFYTKDANGNVRNLIAEAINLPKGAATEDKPDSWFDGYNGPRTSIRNFGSTAYGDGQYYKDLVDEFASLGLTYAPNDNWKGDNGTLYGLSIPEIEAAKEESPKVWDWKQGDWIDKPTEEVATTAPTKAATTEAKSENTVESNIEPVKKWDGMRYAGLFGPAVGLGLIAAGIGKPDYSGLDAAVERGGNVFLADYNPIGNYLTYRPLDTWFEQNALNAQARATDRALLNTNNPSKAAGLLANGYNSQLASGKLFREAQEYNDALKQKVEEFNRGTNMFNAESYNKTSQFNADTRNRASQYNTGLAMQAAQEKLNRDAGWYNSLYGNMSGLFKGISDLGRENRETNWRNALVTAGAFGAMDEDALVKAGIARYKKGKKAKGGKIQKKRGLTY
jgi:hypothetical protein